MKKNKESVSEKYLMIIRVLAQTTRNSQILKEKQTSSIYINSFCTNPKRNLTLIHTKLIFTDIWVLELVAHLDKGTIDKRWNLPIQVSFMRFPFAAHFIHERFLINKHENGCIKITLARKFCFLSHLREGFLFTCKRICVFNILFWTNVLLYTTQFPDFIQDKRSI